MSSEPGDLDDVLAAGALRAVEHRAQYGRREPGDDAMLRRHRAAVEAHRDAAARMLAAGHHRELVADALAERVTGQADYWPRTPPVTPSRPPVDIGPRLTRAQIAELIDRNRRTGREELDP